MTNNFYEQWFPYFSIITKLICAMTGKLSLIWSRLELHFFNWICKRVFFKTIVTLNSPQLLTCRIKPQTACITNSPGALKCTYVNAGDISAADKIKNWSQRSLCDSSILISLFLEVTLKHWCWSPVSSKELKESIIDAPPNERRVKTGNRGARGRE